MRPVHHGAAALRRSTNAFSKLCWRAFWICVALIALTHVAASLAHAQAGEGTSSAAARAEAIRAIPWQEIAPQDRRAAEFVVKNASMYRRLPTRVIDCSPDMFTFLLQHPEVVIDVWRVMGISQVTLEKMPNGVYHGSDGAGTVGYVRYLFANFGQNANNLAVIYADGAYEGKPLVRPLKARSVLLLRSGAVQETNGRHYITVRIDSFIRIDQLGVELVAKTVQPWISKTADRNFIETLTFVSNFSRTAEKNPEGMQRLATRLSSVDEPTRKALIELSLRTAEGHAQYTAARPGDALAANRATQR